MKKIICCVVLLVSALSSFAQNKNITVSGTVVEAETKEPAVQATVQLLALPDSTYTAGAATLAAGKFTLPKVAAGKYVVKVSYIGFHTKYIPLQLTAGKLNHDLGVVALSTDAIMLEEAVVVAEAPPVIMKEDTTVYSASAYRVAEGAMLEELVKKLPGAEVSEDGKITINGKEIKKIMVDGKEFFSDDPKVSMKNLPVNMVENVKAYDRKSDMARITGIDDGDEEAVLDLTVKKGMKQGWVGNVIGGYGNKDRYEANVMINRFLDDSSLSIIGAANNTNGQGVSELGDQGGGGGGRGGGGGGGGGNNRGVNTTRTLGVNFAKDTEKLQLGGNLQYGYSENDARQKTSTERFLGETSSFGNSTSNSLNKRHNARADFRMEWRPDTMTTIIVRPNVTYSRSESVRDSWSETLNNDRNMVNEKKSVSTSKSDNISFNGRLQLFRKLNSVGRNVSLGGNFGYSDSETNSDAWTYTEFFEQDSIVEMNRHTDRNSDSRNWSVSASYTEPVFKNHFLQLRYEFAHRKRLSESLISDPDSILIMPNGYVESLSSRVENFYDTHTIDASIRGIHPKMMYSAGVTFTPQSSRSETTVGPNASVEPKKQDVTNFAPQLMLRYNFSKQHTLTFRYRGRSDAPDIESLQEVIDQTDPLNIQYGNPNLKPSFAHNAMLFYNNYIPASMQSYAFNMFFTATQNAVANRTFYDAATGGTVSRRVNVNGNWNLNGFFSFNTPLKNKKFTLSTSTNARFSDAVSYTQATKSSDGKLSTTHYLTAGERLTGSYRSDAFDVSLIASVDYSLTQNSMQTNSNRETFDYYFGGSTNINLPKRFYLSTDVKYRLKDGYSGDFNNSEVIWNAQVSKTIFKNNAGTIRFKIYDILQQQSNLSRNINETMMSDTEYNTLGSYFMVHFVYRFNTLGGGQRGGGNREGGPGRGFGGPGGPGGRPGGHGGGRPF